MNITVFPKKLSGQVTVPPSKSVAHRMVIAAALSNGVSEITNLYPSVDILATMDCMRALGAKIDFDGDKAVIEGIKDIPESAVLDCCESGSTLRFLIPVACALGVDTQFIGRGRLPQRPITPYLDEFPKHGVSFEYNNTMPFSTNGKLTGGKFYVDGGISSQFITGLLFALPLLEEDSEIILTSHLESKPYVDITLGTLREHGCQVEETENGYYGGADNHAFITLKNAHRRDGGKYYQPGNKQSSHKSHPDNYRDCRQKRDEYIVSTGIHTVCARGTLVKCNCEYSVKKYQINNENHNAERDADIHVVFSDRNDRAEKITVNISVCSRNVRGDKPDRNRARRYESDHTVPFQFAVLAQPKK